MLMHSVFIQMRAQTYYGASSGTLGSGFSYFGNYAGNASLNSSAYNSFFGAYCGRHTTTGYSNTAMGSKALYANTEGWENTAVGDHALYFTPNGYDNVAIGRQALYSHTNGGPNTAYGYRAMFGVTEGLHNTATGALALYNYGDSKNVATGFRSLYNLTFGGLNTVTGAHVMEACDTANGNSAYGVRALSISSGDDNSVFGANAFYSEGSLCFATSNTVFGAFAGFSGAAACGVVNATVIGYNARATASNQVRIGNSSVTSIGGQVAWSNLSDGRFKRDIKKDVAGLDFINQLNPVSYTVDKDAFDKFLGIPDSLRVEHAEVRKTSERRIGFVAQEVEAVIKTSGYVFSGVEVPQNESDPYTIRYAEFVVPLVRAVQELSLRAQARQKQITGLTEILQSFFGDTLAREKQLADPAFSQNNPAQFSGITEIHIELPEVASEANLIIYNREGKQMKDILVHERGRGIVKILDSEFSPGVYLYALIADGDVVATDRITLK